VYSEPVPEFDGETPPLDDVCRSVWETALAGAGWVNQNDPSFGWDRRTAIAAKAAVRDRAYDIAGHCARFFNQSDVRFWEMEPQGALASTGVCSARASEEYVVYSAAGEPFTVDLSGARKAVMDVRWYDPRTGRCQPAAAVTGGNAQTQFTPPWAGHAVLHLKRKNR
jgi:hypothetical protein